MIHSNALNSDAHHAMISCDIVYNNDYRMPDKPLGISFEVLNSFLITRRTENIAQNILQ